MRAAGLAVLVFALALGGDAFAGSRYRHSPPDQLCHQRAAAYKVGDYCYTSCAPTAACELEVCVSNGEWMQVPNCKARDCRRVC